MPSFEQSDNRKSADATVQATQPKKSRPRRWLWRIILSVAATLFTLFLVEMVIRLVSPRALAVPWQDSIQGVNCPRASARGRHYVPGCFDVMVTFSEQRFRNHQTFSPTPAPGILRIAALGDSMSFGFGAEDDQTYPAQLQRTLESGSHAGYDGVEVLNAGNGGTGTGEQCRWYDLYVKQFHPQVVVLSVTSNDVDDDLRRGHFTLAKDGSAISRSLEDMQSADGMLQLFRSNINRVPGYALLAQHSQLLALIRINTSQAIAARRAKRLAAQQSPADDQRWKARYDELGLPLQAAEIRWLYARMQPSGTKLAVVYFPERRDVYPLKNATGDSEALTKSDAIRFYLAKACQDAGIPFADLTDSMRRKARESETELYYNGADTHPKLRGYALFAQYVAELLRDLNWIAAP